MLEELPSKFKQKLYDFIKQNHNLLNDNIDELYLLCPVGLKRDLVDLLKSANIRVSTELINKVEFLLDYSPLDLDRIVIDHEGQLSTTTNNIEYIITNWNKFDFPEYKELNEALLTDAKVTQDDLKRIITYVKQQIALNDDEGITSEHLRSRATDPSHAMLFNKYHSVDIINALNASDSGLLAIPHDKDTNNFIVILN